MSEVAYLSSTGEVKIPLKIRTKLGLQPGQKFDVRVRNGDVRLVQLELPSTTQVEDFVSWKKRHPGPNLTRTVVARKRPKRRATRRRTR